MKVKLNIITEIKSIEKNTTRKKDKKKSVKS